MDTGVQDIIDTQASAVTASTPIFSETYPNSNEEFESTASQYIPQNLTAEPTSAQIPVPDIGELVNYIQKSGKEFINQEQEKFNRHLLQAFALEPIEDGFPHPAEQIIEKALKTYHLTAIDWIKATYIRNIERVTIAAGIMRCIGRLNSNLTSIWGIVMAASGLLQPNIEIRDAAVRALEAWGGQEALVALKAHVQSESSSWLKKYIEQVIIDLSE